jgi:hypothetical protein
VAEFVSFLRGFAFLSFLRTFRLYICIQEWLHSGQVITILGGSKRVIFFLSFIGLIIYNFRRYRLVLLTFILFYSILVRVEPAGKILARLLAVGELSGV